MTAEIAILNKQGVALAADSAVSIGNQKVYNSANKLFALSKRHPVGIMVYGNAQLMGLPWETIIKFYRANNLMHRDFDRLEEYAEDFLSFLRTTELIAQESETLFVCRYANLIVNEVREGVIRKVEDALQNTDNAIEDQTKKFVDEEIKALISGVNASQTRDDYASDVSTRISKKHSKDVGGRIKRGLENLPISAAQIRALQKAIFAAVGKIETLNGTSGIVIAGYGKKDIFPVVQEFSIEGRVEGYLKVDRKPETKITLSNTATILPFAQREMVDTFMRGIDPSFFDNMHTSLRQILHKVPQILASQHGFASIAADSAAISQTLDDLLERFSSEVRIYQNQYFVKPVLDSVGSLPIEDLAAMAEALVNLTSFKRKVTMVPESVGGPIDVAVISKGDGFIWIKRKHYFSPNLNPHFFERLKENS